MKKMVFLFLTALTAIIFVSASRNGTVASDEEIVKITKHLSQLSKVNDKPKYIYSRLAMLCAPAHITASNSKPDTVSRPHESKYINVYITKNGFDEMTTKKFPVFPEGTIIVKEKFPEIADTVKKYSNAEFYTIMIKREKGYNISCGDWEFVSVDAATSKVQRGILSSCMSCHSTYTSTDFISRQNYLSQQYLTALK